jgi:Na+-translocating ferredoxin:NAD+ oxidoreductase RnfC subunit
LKRVRLAERLRNAGVVGAGGAGFPAHIKAEAQVDTVIANGAECEPLLGKDVAVMVHHAGAVVRGLQLMMEATGATRGIIGIKGKHTEAITAVQKVVGDPRITIQTLGDFYPSGDEFVLVYEATGRLIPPAGFPVAVGVVVNNVETLYNVARAAEDQPVTEKFITVAGAVRRPVTLRVPVGTTFGEALEAAGGASAEDVAVFSGGVMMGHLTDDLNHPVTKTCAGLVVLPRQHTLVVRRLTPEASKHRIGKSACDQCSYCTELCPRYLLGYDVQPHKVMRSLGFTATGADYWNLSAALCCSCGLCTLYACPEALFPKEACDSSKEVMRRAGTRWTGPAPERPHPMYEGRRTPLRQLVRRLDLGPYDTHAVYLDKPLHTKRVVLPLRQHSGEPAICTVRQGAAVRAGECVGEIPPGATGGRIHASIDGEVSSINGSIVIERR